MKKISAFVGALVLMALLPLTVLAQQISQNTLKQVLTSCGSLEQYLDQNSVLMQQLKTMAKAANPNASEAEAQDRVMAYLNDGFSGDMAELMAPYYAEMTESEGQELLKAFSTPEAKAALKRMALASAQQQAQLQQQMAALGQQIATGKKVAPMAYAEASADFRSKFDKYCEVCCLDQTIEASLNGIKQSFAGVPADQVDKMLKVISDFTKENTRPMLFNIFCQGVSADDLQVFIDSMSTPVGQKFMAGNVNLAGDALNFGMKFSQLMMNRLK